MLSSSFCQSFSLSFLSRWRPKNLLVVGLILTFLSMSALLLSNDRFTDNYFDVVEKLKGLKNGVPAYSEPHSIETLVKEARVRFREVTDRQSKTLMEATKEYERRYKRNAPQGFAAWYTFARDNGITRIDEYDDLMKWIEPFRQVPASTLKEFINAAYKGPGMSRWTIKNGSIAAIGNADHDLDTRYGFPLYRGEGPWPPETLNKGGISVETLKKDKPKNAPKKGGSNGPPDKDDPIPEKEETKETSKKVEDEGTPSKDQRNKRKRNWGISDDIEYFRRRDDPPNPPTEEENSFPKERPADDGIPQGEHPLDPFWHTKEIKHLLDPMLLHLPDLEILFNEWDEPRVLLDPNYSAKETKFEAFQQKSYRNAYKELVEIPCSTFDNSTYADQEYPFAPFLSDLAESKEVCRHPNIGNNYGMVLSPNALSVTRSLVPILSMSRISSVADLTYPNVLYIEGLLRGEYDETKDGSWSSKYNDLYWTGRTSGGLANSDNDWHEYHRQRFVATVNGLVNNTLSAEFQKDKDLYKVRFPAVNQCDEAQCEEMTAYFSIDDKPDPFDEVYQHRFQLDIDGNVFSRRFYSLMFSKSTVLKQTWQQEYFDEWLFPWVHYIPVSMDFEELPETMRFLANTKAGRLIAQEVATAGREWAVQTFRAVEGSSYLYRLLLEYAELFKE